MPLRPRCEYAAVLPRSLPGSSCPPPREFPAHTLDGCAPLPAQIHQVLSRCRIKGVSHAGSSRTPLRPACRTRTIWQYWHVPALSGLLLPSPASPGSGCPQLHRPAATGSTAKVSHLHSNHRASRRTHDLRHTAASRMARDPDMPLTDVQWVLGHAHLSTTEIYLTPVPQEVIADVLAHFTRRSQEAASPRQPEPGPYRPETLNILFGEGTA